MFGKSKSKTTLCLVCDVCMDILIALVTLVTVASLGGLYMAHVTSSGFVFGTISCSLSIMAVTFNLFLVRKLFYSCGSSCNCSMPAPTMKLASKLGSKKK